jgi:signal transduction histidine kinase
VQVADTGPGIPLDEQNKIFQPFYRGTHGRRIVQGMGLGLSIARDIITAHGGEIDLQSTPGTGSRFTLRIPVEILHEV